MGGAFMCISAGMMMALSTGVSVVGQLAQGQAQRQAANADARQAEMQAAQERDAAMAEAQKIRRAGDRTAGAARAQLAASGVDVASGAAVVIDEDITTNTELDAQNTLLTGNRRGQALDYSASLSRSKGKNAVASSIFGSVSTGLTGWKGVKAVNVNEPGQMGAGMWGYRRDQ